MTEFRAIPLQTWLSDWKADKFKSANPFDFQFQAGWWGWFCEYHEVAEATDRLGQKIEALAQSPLLPDETLVWMKQIVLSSPPNYDDDILTEEFRFQNADYSFEIMMQYAVETPDLIRVSLLNYTKWMSDVFCEFSPDYSFWDMKFRWEDFVRVFVAPDKPEPPDEDDDLDGLDID